MTDGMLNARRPEHAISVRLPVEIVEQFSDEAIASITAEIQAFGTRLAIGARGQSANEVVVKAEVDLVASSLRPSGSKDVMKIVSDWSKRVAFLFVGFVISAATLVFSEIGANKVPPAAHVTVLLTCIVVSSLLIGCAVTIDVLSVRRSRRVS